MQADIDLQPPRAGRDEKRDAILRIAQAAFLADGFAGTSMSSIAAKVGGSKATLYNYFASKDELFVAVCEEKCQEFQTFVFSAESIPADFRTMLIRLGERLVRTLVSDDKIAIYRMITAETGRFPELGRAFYQIGPRHGEERLSQLFEQAIGEGHLKPGDTRLMARQFFALCKDELHHKKLWGVTPHPTDRDIREHVTDAIATFLAAFGADERGV